MGETDPFSPDGGEGDRRFGRGVFLAALLGGASSLVWGKSVWGRISPEIAPVTSLVPLIPSRGWRIYTVGSSMPRFDPASWRLEITGMVEHPQSLSYNELLALPQATQVSDFHCVTGWTVGKVHWRGVRIEDALAAAKPQAGAHGLRFVSAEHPYDDYLTLKQATLADVMLAYDMDGRPLRREHGAPLRLVIPDMYGYKNVKWLTRIELLPAPGSGYWEKLGYDRDAWVGRSNGYGT